MTLEICEKTRIAYYWLTREEDDNGTKEMLKPAFMKWKSEGYKVCVFISGTGNLVDLTKELLIHNKELAVQRDQLQNDETIASPDGRGNFASVPQTSSSTIAARGCINTPTVLQCCTDNIVRINQH